MIHVVSLVIKNGFTQWVLCWGAFTLGPCIYMIDDLPLCLCKFERVNLFNFINFVA